MAITNLTDDLDIIQALSDTPNATEGLTSTELKTKFDEAGNTIKTYINDTLTDEVDTLDSANVKLTGNQTIAGIKTFSSFPVTPSSAPATDYQSSNKKFVDDSIETHEEDTSVHGVSTVVGTTESQILTNKNIDVDNNTVSNIETDNFKTGAIDTDLTSVSGSDNTLASAKAIKTYVDSQSPLTIPNDSITETKMANDMKKDITGGVASFNLIDNSFYTDLQIYYGNTKLLDDFQDGTPWTVSNGVEADDTTNFKIGSQSIRATSAGAVSLITNQNNATFDLSILNNGQASTDNDYVFLVIYIEDVALVTQASSFIAFSQDAVFAGANFKSYSFSDELATGWNYLKLLKSDFTTVGGGAWSGIQSIRIAIQTTAATYYSTQLIDLIKKDPTSAKPNPYQVNGVAELDPSVNDYFLGYEFDELKIIPLDDFASADGLRTSNSYDNFVATSNIEEENATYTNRFTWYVDSSNYIQVFGTDTLLRITKVEAGASVNVDVSHSLGIDIKDTFEIMIIKNGANITAKLIKNGVECVNNLTTTTISTSSTGQLISGGVTTSALNIKSISVTNISHANYSNVSDFAKQVQVKYNAGVFVADELKYGQFGIDTSNDRLYMKYSATQVIYFTGTVV